MVRTSIRSAAVLTLSTLVLAGGVLAGCSGGNGGGGSGSAASGPEAGSTAPAGRPAEHSDVGPSLPSATVPAAAPTAGRLLTRTGSMQITSTDALSAATRATTLAEGFGGYETAGSSDAADGSGTPGSTATVDSETYAIPSAKFAAFRTALRKLGTVTDESVRTTDVTDGVVDLTSRIATQRESLARIRTLFAKATDITDITAIEAQLTTREAALESMEAQLASTRSQVAMSTWNVTFTSTTPVRATSRHHPGFLSGLQAGWHGLAVSVVAVSHVLGAMLPFLVPLGLLGAVGVVVARRLRRNRPEKPVDA